MDVVNPVTVSLHPGVCFWLGKSGRVSVGSDQLCTDVGNMLRGI